MITYQVTFSLNCICGNFEMREELASAGSQEEAQRTIESRDVQCANCEKLMRANGFVFGQPQSNGKKGV